MGKKNKKRKNGLFEERRYDTKEIHEEREYGFFWYSWLWSRVRKVLILLCSLLLVTGLVSLLVGKVYDSLFAAVEPDSQETVNFIVESGSSVSKVAADLVESGLLKKDFIFKYIVQLRGLTNSIRYGTYSLSPSMTAFEIVNELASGIDTREVTITIIPGWTVENIADYLVKEGLLQDREEFLSVCQSSDGMTDSCYLLSQAEQAGSLSERVYPLEGYLAPDTYRVFATADAASIARTLLGQTNNVVDDVFYSNTNDYEAALDEEYTGAEQYETTLSMDEVLILASIIEKEAGDTEDYAKVAAVYYNRLNAGMPLESDATVAYLKGGTGALTDEDRQDDNPYNTYMVTGLPAGPISNPSRKAIRAALYPDTDYIKEGYLYFCTEKAGSAKLVFARTRSEHEKNLENYRKSVAEYSSKGD